MKTSCEKAVELCTKSQYGEVSWWQTMKLKFHLFYCKNCSEFSEKNTKFTSLCEAADIKTLDSSEKEALKEALKQNF